MNKQTLNTFGGGLNMDLNSLVTPNNIMTNCLNGTLITYNGNENVLQNDMGNGKVHDAYLPSGWVPVGMKEYGGIIYVASYNPETLQSLIGSFPSPLQNYENSNLGHTEDFQLLSGKYKLFIGENKDLELRPGNKLAVNLDIPLNYNEVLPNFYADLTEHKKRWEIKLELLSKNGTLSDITDDLINLNDVSCLDSYELYKNYFFISDDVSLMSDYLRIYTGNQIGTPYIEVLENLANSMNTQILLSKDSIQKKLSFTIISIIDSNSLLKDYIKNGITEEGLSGIFYKITGTSLQLKEGYIPMRNEIQVLQCNSLELLESKKDTLLSMGIPEQCLRIEGTNLSLLSNYVVTEKINSNFYTLYLIDTIEVDYENDDDIIEIQINPYFTWKDTLSILNTLEYSLKFDLNKVGTGQHKINLWRYFYTDLFLTITWGMESYPKAGERIHNFKLRIFDYNGQALLFLDKEYLTFEQPSFNGEFSFILESELFKVRFPYIVKLSWMVNGKEYEETRWILPTKLYNELYTQEECRDFSSASALPYIKEINKVPIKISNIKNTPIQTLTSEDWDPYETFSTVALEKRYISKTNNYSYSIARPLVNESFKFDKDYPFKILYDKSSAKTTKVQLSLEGLPKNYNSEDPIQNVAFSDSLSYYGTASINSKLTTYHPIQYINQKCPIIDRLYSSYDDGVDLKNSDVLVVISVLHKSRSMHSDPIILRVSTYSIDHNSHTATREDVGLLYYDTTSLSFRESFLADYWDAASTFFSRATKYTKHQYCIPVLFFGPSYIVDELKTMVGGDFQSHKNVYYYFNYAVRTEDNSWALYTSASIPGYVKTPYDFSPWDIGDPEHNYSNLKTILNFLSSVNETTGFHNTVYTKNCMLYYRMSKPNFYIGDTIWAASNIMECNLVDETLTYDAILDVEGEINVSYVACLNNEGTPYNQAVKQLLLKTNSSSLEEQLCFKFNDSIEDLNVTLKLFSQFNYLETYPSNVDLYNTIKNGNLAIKLVIKIDGKYYFIQEELDSNTVYKLISKSPLKLDEVPGATVLKYKSGEQHIISTYLGSGTDQRFGDTDTEATTGELVGTWVGIVIGGTIGTLGGPIGMVQGGALGNLLGRTLGDTKHDRYEISLQNVPAVDGDTVFGTKSWNV